MSKFLARIKSIYSIKGAYPSAQQHLKYYTDETIYRPLIGVSWMKKEIVARCLWWGHRIEFNYKHLGVMDQEYLETNVLRHELIHSHLLTNWIGVARRTPYYHRFHEAMAYYFEDPTWVRGFMAKMAKLNPKHPKQIFQAVLKARKEGLKTGAAKDKGCREVTGMG